MTLLLVFAAGGASAQSWRALGPAPIHSGQIEGMSAQNNPVTGAVRVVAPHPTNSNIVYIGAINGGVWKTSNAQSLDPVWTALTDFQASLSIGSLAFDRLDTSGNTLVAGMGRFSSLGAAGGTRQGILRTTNGGTSWTPLGMTALDGRNIAGIAARGSIIMAAVSSTTTGSSGLYRSTDTGATFTVVSGGAGTGLPAGSVADLVADAQSPTRFYAGGAGLGVYRSDDNGATWTNATGAIAMTGVDNIRLATHFNAATSSSTVFAAVTVAGQLAHVYRCAGTPPATAWVEMDLPQTFENTALVGIHPGGQGGIHFSLCAHPTNPDIVFIGGDRQPTSNNDTGSFPNSIGARNYDGRLFRGDASQPAGSQWRPLTHNGTSNNSAPHADSRTLAFDTAGTLWEGDDGGVYRRLSPDATTGLWNSPINNLCLTEFHSVAWDHVSHVAIGGTQDNGTNEKIAGGTTQGPWRQIKGGDGGRVVVDDSAATTSIRYASSQFLGGFVRRTYSASNTLVTQTVPALALAGGGGTIFTIDSAQFYTPVEINGVAPARLLFLMNTHVFETLDRASTVTDLGTFSGQPTAAAYGGRDAAGDAPGVIYLGAGNAGDIYFRQNDADPLTLRTTYPGTLIVRDIVAKPTNYSVVYVCDSQNVYTSPDKGLAWTSITGNLRAAMGLTSSPSTDLTLRSIEYVPRPGGDVLIVGGVNGVYSTPIGTPGTWSEFGTDLPSSAVRDVRFDAADHLVLAGTLGRGGWTIAIPACVADVDDGSGMGHPDGGVTIDDLVYYILVFTDGRTAADVDDGSGTGTPDGGVTIDDLLYFVARFTAGC